MIGEMHSLRAKLCMFKKDVSRWDTDVFGNIFHRLKHAERGVRSSEVAHDLNPYEANRVAYNASQAELNIVSSQEIEFWK